MEQNQEIAYQSEPEVVESQESPIEEPSTEPVTTQEEYDEIKYNKETVKIPVTERQNYLQKGYNYDKVQQKASELESQVKYLEKRARQEGFDDVQSYLKAIDEYEQQQQIQAESQRMGVDPDTYAKYFQPVNQKLQQYEQELTTYRTERQEREVMEKNMQAWGELYKAYPQLNESGNLFSENKTPDWYNDGMQQFINMGYQPLHAYELAHKETLFKQKEQEILARVTGRDAKQILPSNDSPNNVQFDPSNMSFDEIKSLSQRVQNGERITF